MIEDVNFISIRCVADLSDEAVDCGSINVCVPRSSGGLNAVSLWNEFLDSCDIVVLLRTVHDVRRVV